MQHFQRNILDFDNILLFLFNCFSVTEVLEWSVYYFFTDERRIFHFENLTILKIDFLNIRSPMKIFLTVIVTVAILKLFEFSRL